MKKTSLLAFAWPRSRDRYRVHVDVLDCVWLIGTSVSVRGFSGVINVVPKAPQRDYVTTVKLGAPRSGWVTATMAF